MSQSVILVNTYYPIEYFTSTSLAQSTASSSQDFWASTEELPPKAETLLFDFGRQRPLNFIDFEIASKPVDILIEYQDGSGNWQEVISDPEYAATLSVQYLPSKTNPWTYIEHHFELVQTQYVRITLTRRTEHFPLDDSDPFPWSIEMRNARFMNVIQTLDEFLADEGTDILGNSYRTDIQNYDATNVIDGDETTVWQSRPNPSPFGVEALYFDLRIVAIAGTMGYLDQGFMGDFDSRSQGDMESYRSEGLVVDEIYVDPVTFGPSMHIYYSLDDTPEWDNKLWIPINRSYVLKKGFHSLPTPVLAKFVKLEFTNLAPTPYPQQEYPDLPVIEYNKFPTWVQNYFHNLEMNPSASRFIDPVERVSVDPLILGFQTPVDALTSGLDSRNSSVVRDTNQEIRDFLTDSDPSQDQTAVEDQIVFNSPYMYQIDLVGDLDRGKALSRRIQVGESGWNAEIAPPTEPAPTIQSVPDLSDAHQEKVAPAMYFPYKCRHQYQVVKTKRPSKIAFFAAIREVGFYRRDYTAKFDEPYYIETFDDTAHFGTVNDFVQDDWRFVVMP